MDQNVSSIRNSTEPLQAASKEAGQEVSADHNKWLFISCHHSIRRSYVINPSTIHTNNTNKWERVHEESTRNCQELLQDLGSEFCVFVTAT